jgi:hypothetical protein
MSNVTDAIASLNVIDRLEGIISSFLNADWKGASRDAGLAGILDELARTLTASNRWRIVVPRACEWSGAEIERYLAHYGIAIWGRGFAGDDIYFSVKERQANWAEYLLLRRGIPISGPLFNPQNAVYGQQHAPGDAPPAWADHKRQQRNWADRFLDFFG